MRKSGMAGQPLVSVVVPFLNSETFLEECIESVLNQTYGSWELLLVDDGSRDGSTAVARRYAQHHPERIRYFEHPGHVNRGTSASRNLGMQHARGKLIAFLDADDVWLPHKLAEQVALIEHYPDAGLLYGRAESWYSWTGDPSDAERDTVPPLGVEPDSLLRPHELLQAMLTREARSPDPSSMLVRREVAEAIGGWEEGFPGMYDDQVFVAKLNLRAPVLASNHCWIRYRRHPDSCYSVAKANGSRRQARITYLRWIKEHLVRERLRDSELWQIAERELKKDRGSALHRVRSYITRVRPGAVTALKRGASILPPPLRHWMRTRWRGEEHVPPAGYVRFGSLRRLAPISRKWGKDRGGLPIDRYYIERFLAAHASDIRGRVLEVGDDVYTNQFGGAAVEHSDVLHAAAGNPKATIIGDLTDAEHVPSNAFDCVILTQVLQFIDDPQAAIRTLNRILRPDGVLLLTASGISQISRFDMERWGEFWRFTTLSLQRLLTSEFPVDGVRVESFGNVLASVAFLHGLAAHELRQEELDYQDPDYQLLIAAWARKPSAEKSL